MRPFGITSKLFIAVLLTNVITAVAIGLGVRAAFESGFESYVREREDQRLTRLAILVANAYRENGSWDFLKGNDTVWQDLNHQVRPTMPPGPRTPRRDGAPASEGGTPREGPPRFFRPPPAAVLDESGNVVVGDVRTDTSLDRKPVMIDGTRVGWLVSHVRETAFDIVDRRFRDEQVRAGWIVALLAIALSAIVTFPMARGLIAPLKRLGAATRRMADGDYATRVQAPSRDEIGALVDDFNRLANALEKHEASRRNLMADLSHELRTPLAVLKGELEAIEDGVRPATKESIGSLQAEVARLSKLVDDIHDLALADLGGLAYKFETTDLGVLVRDRVDRNRERFAAKPLDARLDAGTEKVLLRADEARLAQVLDNLADNSLRYTDGHGSLKVALRTDKATRHAVIDWQDSAPGVPEEAIARVFERLYRAESSRNRERGGSGLGLSIVKSIVEAHGGTVAARPSPLGGLWIELRLPLEPA
jgi:two-component system sensor histidine kinase BaeS